VTPDHRAAIRRLAHARPRGTSIVAITTPTTGTTPPQQQSPNVVNGGELTQR